MIVAGGERLESGTAATEVHSGRPWLPIQGGARRGQCLAQDGGAFAHIARGTGVGLERQGLHIDGHGDMRNTMRARGGPAGAASRGRRMWKTSFDREMFLERKGVG
jgi:hypothetical protein